MCQTPAWNPDYRCMIDTQNGATSTALSRFELAILDGDDAGLKRAVTDLAGARQTGASRPGIRISRHAVDRYLERVDPLLPRRSARLALEEMFARGRSRPTPRHWMRHVRRTSGLRFIYWHERPDVCLLVVGETLVTVITRRRLATGLRLGSQPAEVLPFPVRAATGSSGALDAAA